MPGETNDLRGCIFDIYCVTDDGKHFIVEMQNRWVPFFAAAPFRLPPHALKGQKLLAQGNTLGINEI
ncbi:Rpn family recombination-promoting nuclease/putative transposase [Prevotella copri]|nr:Rpn family recombination-promoting nuclease/putative transposase [Segatella copri]